MDLRLTPEQEELRAQARSFSESPGRCSRTIRSGVGRDCSRTATRAR